MIPVVKYALAVALGAAGMYWFEAARGRHGQGPMRDTSAGASRRARRASGIGRNDGHRLHGGVASSHALIRSNEVSDEILAARVRSALGRTTSRAGAIDVSCSQGVVILRGAVLKHEHPRVMRAARAAAGASSVLDELSAYRHPDLVPPLTPGHPPTGL